MSVNTSLGLSFAPSLRLIALTAAGVLAASGDVRAHNPDTSYARLLVARDRTSLKLTYDVTSLIKIVPTLDADGDRRLTRQELDGAAPKIAAFLQRTIEFEVDQRKSDLGKLQPVLWPPDAGEAIAEKDYHAATSLIAFTFDTPLAAAPQEVWIQFDFFETLGLRHTVLGAIAHEGAELEVLFTPFEPDYLFETKYVPPPPTTLTPTATASSSSGVPAVERSEPPEIATSGGAQSARSQPPESDVHHRRSSQESLASRLWLFFRFGVVHIVKGYDHILFLLALIVVSRFGELVKIVTSFTVAHSITLALATLGWVEIPSNLVETAIAATIVFTALENFWAKDTSDRWKLTFVFGLIHGFGFAGVLRELHLPTDGFVRSLLAFNLGVEVGQLMIVAVLAVPIRFILRSRHGRTFQRFASAVIALCGLGWFLDRACGLNLMPF